MRELALKELAEDRVGLIIKYLVGLAILKVEGLYPKKIQKYITHVTHPLSSGDINIISPEASNFCYIKKYRYRLHFNS